MSLGGNHHAGDAGHVTDHNLLDTAIAALPATFAALPDPGTPSVAVTYAPLPSGGDDSAALQALIDTLATSKTGTLVLRGAAYKANVTVPAGTFIAVEGGVGCSVEPYSYASQAISVGSSLSNTDFFYARHVQFVTTQPMDYALGVVKLTWVRNWLFDHCSSLISDTATLFMLDSSYIGKFVGGSYRLLRYGVGFEITSDSKPSEMLDTISFDNAVFYTNFGGISRSAQLHGVRFSAKIVNDTTDVATHVETTTSGSTSAAATSLPVTSATGYAVNDAVWIDYGTTIEVAKVTAVNTGTNTLTLSRGLRYAHSAGRPVVKGGFGVSLSPGMWGDFTGGHMEFVWSGIVANDVRALQIGGEMFSACGELVRPYGDVTDWRIGAVVMNGNVSQSSNVLVNATSATAGHDKSIIADGPYHVPGGSATLRLLTGTALFLRQTNTPARSLEGAGAVESIPRYAAAVGKPLSSGRLYLMMVTPTVTTTITQIGAATQGAGSSGLTLARMGIYTVNSSNGITLVAATASDTGLFVSGSDYYERSLATGGGLPAAYQMVAGTVYALGVLLVGTGMPYLAGMATAASTPPALAPMLQQVQDGQTDLPTSAAYYGTSPEVFWIAAKP